MRVLFYGRLAEIEREPINVDLESETRVGDLRKELASRFPSATDQICSRRNRACVGGVIVGEDHLVDPHDEVEFFPPVSGG